MLYESLTCGIEKEIIQMNLLRKQKHTDFMNQFMVARVEGCGGGKG